MTRYGDYTVDPNFTVPVVKTPPTEPATPAAPQAIELKEAQVIRLEPGDVVVFTTPLVRTPEEVRHIHAILDRTFPDNRNLVLSQAELQVLRAAKDDA